MIRSLLNSLSCFLNFVHKNIVTGQQIGLLGGPLYTTYKVLGAIRYANASGDMPVYWLETNDADFNEINHLEYIDANGDLQTLTWEIDSQSYSCGFIEIDNALIDLLCQFFDTMRQSEFTPALKALALRCYVPGQTLGEASYKLAQELFGEFGVELFDPAQHAFKEFIKPLLFSEADRTPPGEQCNLFCMVGKKRSAIFKTEEGGYRLRDGTPIELEDYDLVPNVKTRNVCQDAYLHTHAYIAGPGEIEYIKALDPIYEFHGVRKADVIPRMSITLLEPKVKRLLKKLNITLQDVFALEKPELLKKVLRERTGFDYQEATQKSHQLTKAYLDALQEMELEVKAIERYLDEAIKQALGKKRAQEKAQGENALKIAEQLSDLLMPFGQRQERVFNLFYYMNLYGGLAFIDWLYAQYDPAHDILEIQP